VSTTQDCSCSGWVEYDPRCPVQEHALLAQQLPAPTPQRRRPPRRLTEVMSSLGPTLTALQDALRRRRGR
jgi:hypothetical protein